MTVCQSERSCSSLVDEVDEVDVWLKLPTLCEIGELVIAVEVSCSPETSPGTVLRWAASWSPTLSTRGELSASAERSARPPSARPTAGSLDVAASRNVWTSLPARRRVVRSRPPTFGEKIQKRGLTPCLNFPGGKIVYIVFCINCVLKSKDGGGLNC